MIMKTAQEYFKKYVSFLRKKKLYPSITIVDGLSSSPEITIDGGKFLTFCSNNYLGLADNPLVVQRAEKAIKKYGIGSGSTRLLSGTLDVQIELERELASFFHTEDTITFSSGYLANVGVPRMLVDPFPYFSLSWRGEDQGIILSDEFNHASIIDGIRLAKAERAIYGHNDVLHLENLLKKNKRKRKLIITDGVFSMDGDLARLREIRDLARMYDAIIMVDDAHGIGVLGPHGEGTAHHLGIQEGIDVVMGSFTKSFGSIGGFVATSLPISDYLRVTARSYIFSDPIPPAFAAGLIETTKIVREGDHLRKTLLENARYMRSELRKSGFTILGEITGIIPLFIGSEKKTIQFSEELFARKILAPAIRRPAVQEGKERIRFSLMATHTKSHIDILLSACQDIGKQLRII